MQVSSTALSHRQAPFGAAAGKAKVQFRLPKRSKRAPIGFFGKHRLPASLQRSFAGTQAAKAESASKDLSKKQLKSLLEKKGLSTEGRKIDLLERLRSAA
ncbi:hypothetical protein F751_0076 [Auxenochlorella protothecoides]|uniref:SAP domain-containing protein n=1 Tax=Auxenochlorella protothecoides TaxID=3075 RepID=A0A087S9W4_AUXPR|nr:hypothetical protein F751_0076 [Auxenochlorella protothecoides]KFM22518.1 hypothetical protein F751_0076 [Auxenochlorella protothecoides]RMZ52523.1 hypothetical protein APUTEX25_003666 [Auxenochlorella protothecoides]|eukprot:RMZ52523.1 hypothetical protein APUTEX25_003666 [Auxenochlorella protothecoides]